MISSRHLFLGFCLSVFNGLSGAVAGDCPAISGRYVCSETGLNEGNLKGVFTFQVTAQSVRVRNDRVSTIENEYETDQPDGTWQVLLDNSSPDSFHQMLQKVECADHSLYGALGYKYKEDGPVHVGSTDQFTPRADGKITWKHVTKFFLPTLPDIVGGGICFPQE